MVLTKRGWWVPEGMDPKWSLIHGVVAPRELWDDVEMRWLATKPSRVEMLITPKTALYGYELSSVEKVHPTHPSMRGAHFEEWWQTAVLCRIRPSYNKQQERGNEV